MAAMSTALTEFADNGNSRTYTYSGHTAVDPRLVIQKRKLAAGAEGVAESSFSVISGTEDANDEILASKVSFQAIVRFPVNGDSADVAAALAIFRDIIAGDEFGNTVDTQEWLV